MINNTFNEISARAILLGGVYGLAAAAFGKDSAGRAFSYIPSLGGRLAELGLESLVDAGFINPLSKEVLLKARYIATATTAVVAFWKGPALIGASANKLQEIGGGLSITQILKSPFKIKQYWVNHPDRILLTKRQAIALGATTVVACAVAAGPERTSWAVDQLSSMPSQLADYTLNTLKITDESWFSSAATPRWAKWVSGASLVAGGWWAVNTAAAGVLWGVNRVLKGVQTPVWGQNWYDRYQSIASDHSKLYDKYWEVKRGADIRLEEEQAKTREYKNLFTRMVDTLAPSLKGNFQGFADALLAFTKQNEKSDTE